MQGGYKMRVDYISDLHLDFYINVTGYEKRDRTNVMEIIEALLLEELGDVLVIAGDLSHHNVQSYEILRYCSELYPQVFFVLGNHDYYLVSEAQLQNPFYNSKKHVAELMERVAELPNVQLLENFQVHEYNGVRFAGATSWYPLEEPWEIRFFKSRMNDSRLIKGIDIQQLHREEMEAYRAMPDVDVLVTHVPPIQIDSHVKFGGTAGFLNELVRIPAKVCIFGHCHERKTYKKGDVDFYINALGYPNELEIGRILSISIKDELI